LCDARIEGFRPQPAIFRTPTRITNCTLCLPGLAIAKVQALSYRGKK
jgi:hypothetical protein